jgi:hypothetical protein
MPGLIVRRACLEDVWIMNKMKTTTLTIVLSLALLASISFSQGAQVKLEFIGFGSTTNQARFTIHNTGAVDLTNIIVSADGKMVKTLNTLLAPKDGIEILLFLEGGTHTVFISTGEGATDSVTMDTVDIVQEGYVKQDPVYVAKKNELLIGLSSLAVLVVLIWVFLKKPRLKL